MNWNLIYKFVPFFGLIEFFSITTQQQFFNSHHWIQFFKSLDNGIWRITWNIKSTLLSEMYLTLCDFAFVELQLSLHSISHYCIKCFEKLYENLQQKYNSRKGKRSYFKQICLTCMYINPSVTFKLNGFNTSVLFSWLQHIWHDLNGNLIAKQTSFHSKLLLNVLVKKNLNLQTSLWDLILCTVKN